MISLNIGVLGHVDCGKTTLTKKLAEIGSTLAFDKHADSGGRRNTLDLGFSCLTINNHRLALFDCPGHSALIRAVLAASNVFDMAIVVIDVQHGIQAQTAEHLLLCSIFCPDRVLIVLNKMDLLVAENRESEVEKKKKLIRKALRTIGVAEGSRMVETSMMEGSEGSEKIRESIAEMLFQPIRQIEKPFLMAIDHCFAVKGKGTVITGTVTQGQLKMGDEIEFATMNEIRKVKSLESWKEKKDKVQAGQRAAILVAGIEEDRFSRTIVSSPGVLQPVRQCLATVSPISFFRAGLTTKTKMHISIGFETVMAECQFLRELGNEFEQLTKMETPCVVWLSFEKPIYLEHCQDSNVVFMASRLEQIDKGCRFAFKGTIIRVLKNDEQLIRFTNKHRTGIIERVEKDGQSAICTGMFKPETNFEMFRNMKILVENGTIGRIEGAFGKNGKFRVYFDGKFEEKMKIDLFMKKYLNDGKIVSFIPNKNC